MQVGGVLMHFSRNLALTSLCLMHNLITVMCVERLLNKFNASLLPEVQWHKQLTVLEF